MTDKEIVRCVANRVGINIKTTKMVLDAFVYLAAEVLQEGEEFKYQKFLKLYTKDSPARKRFNINTGELTEEQEHTVIKAVVSKTFKQLVENESDEDYYYE